MNDTDARRRNHWVSHIARHAHEKPSGVYLRFEGGSVTWAQIHERVSGLAAALRERGVRAGDRVAIMMTNRPEFLETMFAANAIGAIVVPVNFRLAPDEIAYILPTVLHIVDSLPRNASGKVMKTALRREYS